MAQFILVDHSLSGPGSHHYEYATHILRAASELQFQTVLASNRKLRKLDELAPVSKHLAPFRYSTYGGNTLAKPVEYRFTGGGHRWRRVAQQCYQGLRRWRQARRHQKRLRSFRSACAELFGEVRLQEGDHVFLPTLSEFDLMALNGLLRSEPSTRRAQWHLQFHFDFLQGRPPDYDRQQPRIDAMRQRFQAGLEGLAKHRLRFYSTTREMAEQYNRLDVAHFEWLPYPINQGMRPVPLLSVRSRPLRVVLAGRVRDEKGSRQLSKTVADMWPDLLSTGRIQLLVQGQPAELKRLLKRDVECCSSQQLIADRLPEGPIVQVPFPLPLEAYAQLIRQADIGLFLYDSYRYYARCSGVLVEMLSCGVPVIVPAGCWLSGEIQEPNQTYLAWLRNRLGSLEAAACSGIRVAGRRRCPVLRRSVPEPATMLSLESRGVRAAVEATHLCWRIRQLDEQGTEVEVTDRVFRCPPDDLPMMLAEALHPLASSVEFSLSNAFHDHPIEIAEVHLGFHRPPLGTRQVSPLGAVGLCSSDPSQVAGLVRKMVDHYAHYRATARSFSHSYRAMHQPKETLAQLTAVDGTFKQSAA